MASTGVSPSKRKSFLLDNSALNAQTNGLSYRFSKDLHDKKQGKLGPEDLAIWGTVVEGHDVGDGWVKIGDRYLPTTLNGHHVVFEQRDGASEAGTNGQGGSFKETQSAASTVRTQVGKVFNSAKGVAKDIAGDPVKRKIAGSAVGGGIVGGAAGGTVGATAGGVVGGTVGLVGAPFTLGLSIPIGAVVGGGLGLGAGAIAGGSTGMAVGGAVGYRISRNTNGLTSRKEQDDVQ